DAADRGAAPAGGGATARGRGQPPDARRDPPQRRGPAPAPAQGQGAAVVPAPGRVRGRRALPPEVEADAPDSGRGRARGPAGSTRGQAFRDMVGFEVTREPFGCSLVAPSCGGSPSPACLSPSPPLLRGIKLA